MSTPQRSYCKTQIDSHSHDILGRLVGQVVKASASRAVDLGSTPLCNCRVFPLGRVTPVTLTPNFLVAVVNSFNTKTHSSKEMTEVCFENADVKKQLLLQREGEKRTVTFSRMRRNEAL